MSAYEDDKIFSLDLIGAVGTFATVITAVPSYLEGSSTRILCRQDA